MSRREFAEGYIKGAESMFNGRDVTNIMADYRDDAIMEMYAEGLFERYETHDAIANAYRFIFALFPSFSLTKSLVSADDRHIVCEWEGSIDGRRRSYGLDLWWFDEEGRIVRHKMMSFGHLVAAESIKGRMRWMLVHPNTAFRSLRLKHIRHVAPDDPARTASAS